jgi:hypothetical protein
VVQYNLGLVGYKKGNLLLILETFFPFSTLTSLAEPLAETLKIAKEHSPELKPNTLY